MILGHITSTYALHTMAGKNIRRMVALPALLLGALAPDIADKLVHLMAPELYPGRGVFHSAVVLSVLGYTLIRFSGRFRSIGVGFTAGLFLHLLEDWVSLKTFLWPFLGTWDYYEPTGVLVKVTRLYLEMEPFSTWLIEVTSLVYCVIFIGYKVVRSRAGRYAPAVNEPGL